MPTPDPKPWNKDRRVGERTPFTQDESLQLANIFETAKAWHDQALFMVAVDTMFRVSDLLQLTVADVMSKQRKIQPCVKWKQQKTDNNVDPALTPKTRAALKRWISVSGKTGNDYLFTRNKGKEASPICDNYYFKLIKNWAEKLGLDPSTYSTHSTRRTKPMYLFKR
ncbi:MAG: tyrosine-type recombinase/integrase [Gammaproteobacteria bacterium]|nr:tyrosine-type recombinase/integrase [Gammaproteobacteria bacterium]